MFDYVIEYRPDTDTHEITTRASEGRAAICHFYTENQARAALNLARIAYNAGRKAEGAVRSERLNTLLADRPLAA